MFDETQSVETPVENTVETTAENQVETPVETPVEPTETPVEQPADEGTGSTAVAGSPEAPAAEEAPAETYGTPAA